MQTKSIIIDNLISDKTDYPNFMKEVIKGWHYA